MGTTADGARTVGGLYRLLARLGSGAAGTVWRAQDLLLGRAVAVKEVVLPPGTRPEDAEVLRERTRREARAAAALESPHAVTVYDVVEEDGRPWLVLELVEARTLAEAVAADGPLSPARAAQVGLALLAALEEAHRRGILHRDVKPGNVLLALDVHGRPGRVVLTDFGIASSAGDAALTGTGLLLGSPAYIAPERARGQAPGPASDLWSLGATLYTAVEGRPAFDEGGDPLRTVTAVVSGAPAPYLLAGPLAPVLDALLDKDPARRPDAAAARSALTAVAHAAPPAAAAPTAAPAVAAVADPVTVVGLSVVVPGRRARPRRALLAGAGVLLLAAGAVVAAVLPVHSVAGHPGVVPAARPLAAPVPAASSPAPSMPTGWASYTAPAGWTVAVPSGWVRTAYRDQVQFRDPEHRRTLRIGSRPGASATASASAAAPSYAGALDGYRQLRLAPLSYRGLDAADLEFTYTSQATALHVLDRTLAADGTAQSLWWQTQAADFPASLPVFEQVAATFAPVGSRP